MGSSGAHFSREMIAELRSRATPSSSPAGNGKHTTTLQCVVAHLWQCITKAQRIGAGSTTTELQVAVNGRGRMRRPRLPDGYTGSAVLWARPTAAAGDLVAMPLRQVPELVRREVSRIDDGYFRSFIDFASSGAVEEEDLVPTADASETAKSPHVAVYSVLGSPFHDVDFGAGRLFFFMPRHTVDDFKKCCYSSLAAAGDARL